MSSIYLVDENGGTIQVSQQFLPQQTSSSSSSSRGERGERGLPGRDGIDGVNGRDGRDGIDGQDGAPGEQGPAGPQGPPGQDGQDGATGPQGPPGPQGEQGEPGEQGPPGESTDSSPVANDLVVYNNPNQTITIDVTPLIVAGSDAVDINTVTVVDGPTNHANFSGPVSGVFTYTSKGGYGIDSFSYKVSDVNGVESRTFGVIHVVVQRNINRSGVNADDVLFTAAIRDVNPPNLVHLFDYRTTSFNQVVGFESLTTTANGFATNREEGLIYYIENPGVNGILYAWDYYNNIRFQIATGDDLGLANGLESRGGTYEDGILYLCIREEITITILNIETVNILKVHLNPYEPGSGVQTVRYYGNLRYAGLNILGISLTSSNVSPGDMEYDRNSGNLVLTGTIGATTGRVCRLVNSSSGFIQVSQTNTGEVGSNAQIVKGSDGIFYTNVGTEVRRLDLSTNETTTIPGSVAIPGVLVDYCRSRRLD